MNCVMATAINTYNPYPGLRPFNTEETKVYFGRESQTSIAIERIKHERFLAIIGSSGSGKSSFINAGLIPGLTDNKRKDTRSEWRILNIRPGISPIDNLAATLARSIREDGSGGSETPANISRILQDDHEGLSGIFHQIRSNNKEKILIVIDHFEDLFSLHSGGSGFVVESKAEEFINLIIAINKNENLPVHILLAIRSGFLEECHQLTQLSNLIDASNYILPPFTTEDLRQIINGPAAVWGAEIDPGLEKQLIRDIIDKSDQLPLLQHVLNRMWDYWLDQNIDQPISLKEYEAVGGIEEAISIHADGIYLGLSDVSRRTCERMFKAITRKVSDNLEIATPLRVSDIALITRSGIPEVINIADKFRQTGCPFLKTNEEQLDAGSIIELSHESLVRLWKRLQVWVEEEAESVSTYMHLAETSRLYQMGKSKLLSERALQQALLWKEKNEPTSQWAQRHNPAFERTMQFLKISQETYEINEYRSYIRAKRASQILRAVTFTAILSVLITAGVIIYQTDVLPGIISRIEVIIQENLFDRKNSAGTDDPSRVSGPEDETLQSEENQTEGLSEQVDPAPSSSEISTPLRPPTQLSEIPTLDPAPSEIASREPASSETITQETAPIQAPPAGRSIIAQNEVVRRVIPPPSPSGNQTSGQNEQTADATASLEAIKGRMVAISQSLAVRSLQVENNPDLKALLAFQSHIFNEQYNGSSYIPDIYTGLITSIQNLYGNDHNNFKAHTESVNSVVFRPNSDIFYSAASDGQVLEWDLNDTNKTPKTVIHNPVVNNMLAISGNGQWLAVATDGSGIQVMNPRGNTGVYRINWGNDRILTLDFTPDNEHIIFAGSDNSIVKHNISTRNNEIIGKTNSEVLSLAIAPDGRSIAAGTRSGQVLLFQNNQAATPKVIHNEPGNDLLALAFNTTGSRIAAGNVKGEVKILESSTGNVLATLGGHSARVVDVEFCPANKLLASSSFDGSIQIWDVRNFNARPVVIREHGSWVRTIAFDSRGDRMASGSRQEARLRVWTTNINEMASLICEKLTRNMTQAEWNQYIGADIPYMESCPQLTNR
jgi:hypothetical protein